MGNIMVAFGRSGKLHYTNRVFASLFGICSMWRNEKNDIGQKVT